MSDKFLGQIFMAGFNFAPTGSMLCNGQLLPISSNTALFSLLGTTYGGDGTTTFALPNLQGRAPAGTGTLNNMSYPLGTVNGVESVTLNETQNGPHIHGIAATAATGSTDISPGGLAFAATPATSTPLYGPVQNMVPLSNTTSTGEGQPHDNMQPYLAIIYCIVVEGAFPTRQ